MKKEKKKKSEFLKFLEYAVVKLIIFMTQTTPLIIIKAVSNVLGDVLFFGVKKRRNIALENLRHAFKDEKSEEEIQRIARQSCRSFIFTFMEVFKLRAFFARPDFLESIQSRSGDLVELFRKAKKIHDEAGGCIFVTPHIGNWEVLPHVCAAVGIPLAIVARPLDNQHLEKMIYADRTSSGQILIPKRNALFTLQKTLKSGKSIGMLPDQSTMKGLLIDFFGRKATTTPIPGMLAVRFRRPIVVVACCRKPGDYQYEGFVSDPIRPGEYTSEKDEIIRITKEINRSMEAIIRRYPEQYLWIHNRWKRYKGKKEFMS
ncbi:MAG: lysophospholipid acyltransferase family protein [Nitrospirota bacterium]